MAKVKLINTREHAILLNAPQTPQKPIPVMHIPGGRRGDNGFVPGEALVEGDHLDLAKKHPVVQHYFKEGWLKEDKGKEKPAAEPTK